MTTSSGRRPVVESPRELVLAGLAADAAGAVAEQIGSFRTLQIRAEESAPARVRITFRVLGDVPLDQVERAVGHWGAAGHVAPGFDVATVVQVVRQVEPVITRPLRRRVLRPHQTLAELVDPGEDHPETAFYAALDAIGVVGTAALYRQQRSGEVGSGSEWRLRSMATAPRVRGSGLGALLLEACLDHAREQGATLVWCSARVPARGFYERHGFRSVSDVYEVPEIGPHLRMERPL